MPNDGAIMFVVITMRTAQCDVGVSFLGHQSPSI